MLTDAEKAAAFRAKYYGRQDVVAKHFKYQTPDGKTKSGCMPLVKEQPGKPKEKKDPPEYLPVTDERVLDHIRGVEPLSFYVLQTDGTIKFGALDFDSKPDKPDEGYTFADVKLALDVLKEWHIPYRVARSTTNGFHVLFFLKDFYPANRFRAVMHELFHKAGFTAQLRATGKAQPELFPKQCQVAPGRIGNCIKAELIESRFVDERNGFVTDENVWIGHGQSLRDATNAQWQHLIESELVESSALDHVIDEYKPVVDDPTPWKERGRQLQGQSTGGGPRGAVLAEPLYGTVDRLLDGCEAFRALKERCLEGKQPSHDEGIALFIALMRVHGGVEWFEKNVPGWAKTEDDWRELNDLRAKAYSPFTCQTMKDKGICRKAGECFEKMPPRELKDGRWVVTEGVPAEQWPSPSPMRYASLSSEDLLKKLEGEAAALSSETDKATRRAALEALAQQALELEPEQQSVLKKTLRALKDKHGDKVLAARELNQAFDKAGDQASRETEEEILQKPNTCKVNSNIYLRALPHGYIFVQVTRGVEKCTQICSIDIEIEEVRSYVDEGQMVEKVYVGNCIGEGVCEPFEINTNTWEDNNEFKKYFARLLGGHFNVVRPDIDLIRQASLGFSMKEHYLETRSLITQGWVKDAYLTPSVVIDKDGARANTEIPVHLAGKGHASRIDFAVSTDDELRDTLRHIRDELLDCWPRQWTTLALAHTFVPVLMKPLEVPARMTFFMEGESGSGKTQLSHMCQFFYGDFPKLLNMESSGKGLMANLYDAKDSLLVVDDFKGLSHTQINDVKKTIQYAYDGNESSKLNRDGTYRKGKEARGNLMLTGEHFVTSEASVVARTILLEVDRHDTRSTNELFRRCMKRRKEYSRVTPRLLASVLKKDPEALGKRLTQVQTELQDKIAGRQNAPRVAYNLAVNHMSWSLFAEFLGEMGLLTDLGVASYIDEHRAYVEELTLAMADRCEEEQGALVFMRILKQLISAGEVSIQGWGMHEHTYKPTVGFLHENGHIAFYPDITFAQVQHNSRHTPISGTVRSIGAQFVTAGLVAAVDKNRTTKQIRCRGKQDRVWLMRQDLFLEKDQQVSSLSAVSLAEHREKRLIKSYATKDMDEGGIL